MGTLGDVRFCPLALLFCPAAQTGLAGLRGRLDKGYSSKRGISRYLSFSQSVHHTISSHHTQRTSMSTTSSSPSPSTRSTWCPSSSQRPPRSLWNRGATDLTPPASSMGHALASSYSQLITALYLTSPASSMGYAAASCFSMLITALLSGISCLLHGLCRSLLL